MPLLWWCWYYQVQLLADENKELWLMLRAKYPSCSSSSSPTEETSSSLSTKVVRHINHSCAFPGKLVTFCVLCTCHHQYPFLFLCFPEQMQLCRFWFVDGWVEDCWFPTRRGVGIVTDVDRDMGLSEAKPTARRRRRRKGCNIHHKSFREAAWCATYIHVGRRREVDWIVGCSVTELFWHDNNSKEGSSKIARQVWAERTG